MPSGKLRWNLKVWRSRLRLWAKYALHAPRIYRNWPAMFVLGWRRQAVTLQLRNNMRFLVRPRTSDRSTVNEMFVLNPYLRSPGFQISSGDRVLDIGANIGTFTVAAALAAIAGRVYAIEPEPGNFAMLRQNVELNRLRNVELLQAAVGAAAGEAVLGHDGNLSSLMWDRGAGAEAVPVVTLASLVARMGTVDLLKMDCEGAEFDILYSTPPEALQKIRRITMEYHNLGGDRTATTLQEFLTRAGFDVWASGGEWNGLLQAQRRDHDGHAV